MPVNPPVLLLGNLLPLLLLRNRRGSHCRSICRVKSRPTRRRKRHVRSVAGGCACWAKMSRKCWSMFRHASKSQSPPPILVNRLLFRRLTLPVPSPLRLLLRYVAAHLVTLDPLEDGTAVIPLIGDQLFDCRVPIRATPRHWTKPCARRAWAVAELAGREAELRPDDKPKVNVNRSGGLRGGWQTRWRCGVLWALTWTRTHRTTPRYRAPGG